MYVEKIIDTSEITQWKPEMQGVAIGQCFSRNNPFTACCFIIKQLSLEEDINSSILSSKILWTEGPGGVQWMALQNVRLDLATEHTHN